MIPQGDVGETSGLNQKVEIDIVLIYKMLLYFLVWEKDSLDWWQSTTRT